MAVRTNSKVSGEHDMPSVLDRELSDLSEDAFGHQYFSKALRNLIEGRHRPPFSIGLLGSWGTGKSTIKQLYVKSLESDSSGPKGKRRRDRIRPVTFNAWKYGGDEDIKRALLRHVFIQLGGSEEELRRSLYQQVAESAQVRRNLGEWLKEAVLQNAASAFLFMLLLAGTVGVFWLASYGLGLSDQWGITAVLSFAAAVGAFLVRNVVDLRLKSPTLFNSQSVITFPATSAEEYERLLIDQIVLFRKDPDNRSCERLVVFVDDLDRLSATEMVSGLDAVRTFLELPLTDASDNFGVIFVISCDEDRVADALSRGRGRVNPDLPGSVFTRSDARRYLDRLFQFRLEIPPFPKPDMREFTEKKLRAAGSMAAAIEKQGVKLQDLVDRLIHVGVQSPRNAIQIMNAFTQTWWIATQREKSGIGSSAPGVLREGAVTHHPLALASLCVLRVDFPDFYNELQKRPELIQEFTRVVFRRESPESLAIGSQYALKKFLTVEDGKIGNDVQPEYRQLRQYLSSLLDLRWPKSLQPLLLLAQDAISRKYGDRAAELNDAFVSGDTQGVLEIFGHHLDNDNLDREDVRLLEDLAEGLSDDTQARRVNAARVLAAIVDRIPAETRNGLMVPLARQMIGLKDIRTNVGPTAAKEIITSLPSADRQEVADRFAADLLTGQKLDWRLPTGETPNLEELVSDAKTATELVLDVRGSDGLLPATDSRLKAWLLGREVQSPQGAQTLPFAQLEAWMDTYAEHLLFFLGGDYTRLAINELESNSSDIPDKGRMLERAGQVFDKLAEGGQESREELWQQLTMLVAVRDPDGTLLAWRQAGAHAALVTMQQSRTFLLTLANRLHQEMKDDDQWRLDWEAGARQFLDLATRWEEQIDQKTASGILPLVQSWAEEDGTSGYMVRAAANLMRRDKDSWNELITHLTSMSFGELPWTSLEYVASNLSDLNEAQKAALATQLDTVVNTDAIDAEEAEMYTKFIAASPLAQWSSGPLQTHAKTTRTRVVAMSTSSEYLAAVFPAARILLSNAPKGQPAAVLKPLFEQAAGSPDAYPILHREMTGHWPKENEQTGQYDPNTIAFRAIQFIKENPALPGAGDVFRSIVDMESSGLVAEDIRTALSDAATVLWPNLSGPVVACIGQIASFMLPGDVKKILTGNQPGDLGDNIQTIVDALAGDADEERCLAIAKDIIGAPPKQIDDRPDGALAIWLSSLHQKEYGVLKALLEDNGLNEVQRERVLSYVIAKREEIGLTFFVEILPIVLGRTAEVKPLGVIVNGLDGILLLARDSDQRSRLTDALVPTLPSLPNEALMKVAEAINQMRGKGTLERSTQILDKLDGDQMAILSRAIPNSKVIEQYLKSSGTEAAE